MEQTRRRLKADQADEKAKQTADSAGEKAVKASVATKQAVESQAAVEKHKVRNEVVIVGTLRFMPPMKSLRRPKLYQPDAFSDE